MFLSNISENFVLPEIDNINELDNEEKNPINFESIRVEITNCLLKKNKKETIEILKRILKSKHMNSEEILNNNQQWINNFLRFSKDFSINKKKIYKRNFFKSFELVKNGFLTSNIDLSKITSKSNYLLEKSKGESLKNSRNYDWDSSAPADDNLLSLLNKEFEVAGILNESRLFLRKNASVKRARVIFSRPDDNQYKFFLGDLDNYDKKYINYHIDPKGGILKAMVYLSNVEYNSGPFQVVKNSHNFYIDPIKLLFARSIATANYCDSPVKRVLINSLPKGLRSSLMFGRMLKEDSNITKIIDKDLETITSDRSNTVLFIPDKVIHRGAICLSKSRLALQVQIF